MRPDVSPASSLLNIEQACVGWALLGEPTPTWLEARHFFFAAHRKLWSAYRSQRDPRGPLVGTVAQLRRWGVNRSNEVTWHSVFLAGLVTEAAEVGIAPPFEAVRAAAEKREAVRRLERQLAELRKEVAA
ncbi:MAG TPA: hypothetical protein VJN18_35750 [Polyangiaceae bacterium]|nr:hypothetical protein [Polyangiaceae bacterium]